MAAPARDRGSGRLAVPRRRTRRRARVVGRLMTDTKVAIVTGAAGDIGRAVAAELAAEGMAVLVTDLDAQACDAVAKEINAGGGPGRAAGCALDVTDAGGWARAKRLARRFGAAP